MIGFRQCDPRFPFLWDSPAQPAGRWHAAGSGPAHYFADTPEGAWAELLRHEEISTAEDAATLRRALWAVELGDGPAHEPSLPASVLLGGPETWAACQAHAAALRASGVARLVAPSAALVAGGARGWMVRGGTETRGEPRDGRVIVSFEPAATFVGWQVVERGAPPPEVVTSVRHYR